MVFFGVFDCKNISYDKSCEALCALQDILLIQNQFTVAQVHNYFTFHLGKDDQETGVAFGMWCMQSSNAGSNQTNKTF